MYEVSLMCEFTYCPMYDKYCSLISGLNCLKTVCKPSENITQSSESVAFLLNNVPVDSK